MKKQKIDVEKNRKRNLAVYITIITIVCLYAGLHLGYCYQSLENPNLIEALPIFADHILEHPLQMLPSDWLMVLLFQFAGAVIDVYLYNEYLIVSESVNDAQGDATFETDYKQFEKEFVLNPKVVAGVEGVKVTDKFAPYNEEHKRIVRYYPSTNAVEECRRRAQIFAERVELSLDGQWSQRNGNVLILGASGAGKTRFILEPNLLQLYGDYVIVDTGGIEADTRWIFEKNGYKIRRINFADLVKSCRWNPLVIIRTPSDIVYMVKIIIDNTMNQDKKGSSDGGDFWTQGATALLCATIGYLVEVEPKERWTFSNALAILRMNDLSEYADAEQVTPFDELFKNLEAANPNSFAVGQYKTFRQAPAKTALNIMISTAVLLSQYVDIPEFNNLTYKDELELDKLGDEDSKNVIFLNIPMANRTFAWLSAMFFGMIFNSLYRKGEERMERLGLSGPALARPVRFLIDEAKNIGKIPMLDEYISTCRKYNMDIMVIFQNYSQMVEAYGKETANSILGNCDTIVFLGGGDSDTLKIICEKLGKETVKTLSFGNSKGKFASASINKQETGKELMSRIQVEQMSNNECLVFIRSLRPFHTNKFRLEMHPNYKYTAEADKKYSLPNPYCLVYDDEEMEKIRIKPPGEEGYTEPQIVDSARRRAQEFEKQKKEEKEKEAMQKAMLANPMESSETKSKDILERQLKEIKDPPKIQSVDVLKSISIEQMKLLDSFSPTMEFD